MTARHPQNFFKTPYIRINVLSPTATIAIFVAVLLSACNAVASKEKSELIWNKNLPVIGSQSSPRTTDLNKDGVLDIVMGAGKN
jgi:hypothetical protein